MAKPEWGTKRQCPKCAERFSDLNKPFPLTCVACGVSFEPEALLKSKAPLPEEKPRKAMVASNKVDDGDDVEEEFDDDLVDDDDDDAILADDLDDDDDVVDVIDKRPSEDD